MGAELAAGSGATLRRLGDQRHGAVEADAEHVVAFGQRAVGRAVLHVGAVAADAGTDRLAVLWVRADLARQGEQGQSFVEIDLRRRQALRQRGAFWLLLALGLAELQVDAERPLAKEIGRASCRERVWRTG